MGKSLILAVKIIGDATSAIKAMDDASGKSDKFGNALNTAAKWSTAALAGLTGAAIAAGKSASELQQSTGAVESVFGSAADQIFKFSETAADSVGLAKSEYQNMASVFGAQLKNMGLSADEAAVQTNDLIGLGADLAATFGGSTSDAVDALGSLLRGERDPIEKYGVGIKQADIEAQKAAMGLDGLTGEAAKNAELQATLALLTEQTADAQGQFAREADTAAGAAQTAAAHYEDAKAALGEALLPIMAEASEKLAELAMWFQQNAAWITPLAGAVAILAAAIIAINAAYKAYAAIQAVQTAAQWANNAAWLASPITWIILAIIAAIALLVVGAVLVVKHWDKIKAGAKAAWEFVVTKVKEAIQWVKDKFNQAVSNAAAFIQRIRAAAASVFQGVINWVQRAAIWLGQKIMAPILRARDTLYRLRDGAVSVFQSIIAWVRNAIDWIASLASNAVPGWAKKLLGMQSFAAPVTPELAAMSIPDYRAQMRVTPQLSALASPTYDVAVTPAPIAESNLAVMSLLATALVMPRVQPASAPSTTYVDNSRTEVNLPHYLGDKEEIIEEIEKALEKRKRKKGGLISA